MKRRMKRRRVEARAKLNKLEKQVFDFLSKKSQQRKPCSIKPIFQFLQQISPKSFNSVSDTKSSHPEDEYRQERIRMKNIEDYFRKKTLRLVHTMEYKGWVKIKIKEKKYYITPLKPI